MNKIYTKLRHSLPSICEIELIVKILTLLQQSCNSAVPLSSHKLYNCVFHSLSPCSFPFSVYVPHFLNHTIVFLAPPLTRRPRQPPSSPNGSAGSADIGTHLEWAFWEQPGSGLTASATVLDVSAPVCTNEVWSPLRPVSVAQKNKPSTILSSNVQSIDSSWTAWPDGSGRWDNQMTAQHQLRELVRHSSGQ